MIGFSHVLACGEYFADDTTVDEGSEFFRLPIPTITIMQNYQYIISHLLKKGLRVVTFSPTAIQWWPVCGPLFP